MTDGQLPSMTQGPADGVGICLSGGGIRAASFGLGALQALQAHANLLYGAKRADYLAAVSGGSYVAATAALVASQLANESVEDRMDPLAPDSPEAKHILTNGDYLKQWGRRTTAGNSVAVGLLGAMAVGLAVWLGTSGLPTLCIGGAVVVAASLVAWRKWLLTACFFGISGAINVAGLASLVLASAAALVAANDVLVRHLGDVSEIEFLVSPRTLGDWGWLAPALGGLLGGRLFLRALYRTRRPLKLFIVPAAMLVAGTPALVYGLAGAPLPDPAAPAALAGGLAVIAQGSPSRWKLRTPLDAVLVAVPQFGGLYFLSIAIEWVRGFFERGDRWPLFLLAVAFGAACSILLARVSLHHLNRNRLARCFCVKRPPKAGHKAILVPPQDRDVSSLRQLSQAKSAASFPLMMICATANVDDRQASRDEWARFQPFIFSPEACGIQTKLEASFDTRKLEAADRPVGLRVEPLLTLMSAVACAGAAVSPSMGRKTMTGVRSLIALANLRLGTWMPNPHCGDIRDEVAGPSSDWWRRLWPPRKHFALAGGFDEFVPELFGLQRNDAPRAYISDGGHYDNLGLLALIRARCQVIWCVDSQADPHGKASQLRNTINLALAEGLLSGVALNDSQENLYDVFGPANGKAPGVGHAIYELHYSGEAHGKLVVVKLGLVPDSGGPLHDFHARDRWWLGKFPYDHTFGRVSFSNDRVESYRLLGRENAKRGIDDYFANYGTPEPEAAPTPPS